jgi:hypothetical protein
VSVPGLRRSIATTGFALRPALERHRRRAARLTGGGDEMIKRWILGVACVAIATTGCYPERSVDSTTEFAAVTTLFDTTADFASITRYALPDTVLYLPVGDDDVPPATQLAILNQLRENLNALGWQEVTDAHTTPVDVYVSAMITTAEYIYYYWDWWYYWGWYPYWPLSAGVGSTWYYPPNRYAYSYTTGTVLVSMIDAHGISDNRVPLIWSFAVNGVLADATTNLSIALQGIDQAFAQSPYLGGQQ